MAFLIDRGFHSSISHSLLPLFLSESAQAAYLLSIGFPLRHYDPRSLSTIFEFYYFSSCAFREMYCQTQLVSHNPLLMFCSSSN